MKTIENIDFQITVSSLKGKQVLITTKIGSFKMQSFGNVESVETYTNQTNLELDNTTTIEIHNDEVNSITITEEASRNNTQTITIELNNQTITIEFEVN